MKVHIMIGLPGSGKTYYCKQLRGKDPFHIDHFDENWIQKRLWDSDKRFRPMPKEKLLSFLKRYSNKPVFLLDGLFLSTELILDILESLREWTTLEEIVLDYWPENREECLRNDFHRRRTGSALSIETLSIDVDFEAIKATYPGLVKVVTHQVYHTPDYVLFFRPFLPEQQEDQEKYLYSTNWSLGGTHWTYTGETSGIIDAEETPPFAELDQLLEKTAPNLDLSTFRRIEKECVVIEKYEDSDYYSRIEKARYRCDLETMYEILMEIHLTGTDQDNSLTDSEMALLTAIKEKKPENRTELEQLCLKLAHQA